MIFQKCSSFSACAKQNVACAKSLYHHICTEQHVYMFKQTQIIEGTAVLLYLYACAKTTHMTFRQLYVRLCKNYTYDFRPLMYDCAKTTHITSGSLCMIVQKLHIWLQTDGV